MTDPRTRGVPRRRIRPGARLVRAGLLVFILSALLAPAAAASLDVRPGQTAEIVNTGGDPINLRAKPRTSGDVLAGFGEGTRADVLEGPIWDDAGIAWYKVVIAGTRGYMAAEFLDLPGGSSGGDEALDPVVGSGRIVNTGGDPINCRAGRGTDYSIVTTFDEGDAVELTGSASGRWQPVRCGGTGGFVHVDYVGGGGGGGGGGNARDADASASSTVRVTNTGGDPINLRSKPRTSASILDAFGEGARAGVLEGPIVDAAGISWYKVVISGTRGYMAAEFLGLPAGSPPSGGGSGGGDGGGSGVTGKGTISGTNGDGVRCRSRASTSGSVITVLAEGTTVNLRGDASRGWQPVRCGGRNGFVAAEFVSTGGETAPDPDDGGDNDGGGGFAAGTTLMVSATNGEGVRLRSRASSKASVVTVVAEGQNVEVRRGSTGVWIAVRHAAGDGFMHQDFLEIADEATNPPPKATLDIGDHGLVTDSINFRARASFDGAVIAVAKENTVVEVVGGRSNGFYKVAWNGQRGFMHADYLMWTDQEVSAGEGGVGGSGGPDDGPADDGDSTSLGRKMVRYAERYLGYPYVWATHGPKTFDCSGFTYWVTLKTAGVDIGAGTWSQSVAGKPVSFGKLEPGDLVFFQNTYTWGLSHVGMYIGGGQFIHAENETTGIVVSSLSSPYYKTRWFGARRVV